MSKLNFKNKFIKYTTIIIVLIITIVVYYNFAVRINPPVVSNISAIKLERKEITKNIYTCDKSWFKKNGVGLWELYLEGDDFELGAKNGILTKELVKFQEVAFIESLKKMVPSESYLKFLKYFIAWFNRNIDDYIPLEYQKEIYGISFNASPEFNYISTPYHRLLNYHGAHDIGHAVQNMSLVKCTAFGVKGNRSEDGSIIVGRNMDFYVGDDFAKNKIVAFYKPKRGHKFSMITWGGMIGVISGMNDQGLTITLNSAAAKIPTSAKTPVSILARQILQYASTINEAYAIAKRTKLFVAECFFVSSAKDNQFAIIEKTPDSTAIYQEKDDDLILTNHFQSINLKNTEDNLKSINESASLYRYNRVKELLDRKEKHDVNSFAEILRNQKGKADANIGMANEKAVNQLIAHHSIIFMPNKLKFWISTGPYPLGSYICYDLNKVFSDSLNILSNIFDSDLTIPADTFLNSNTYEKFKQYKLLTLKLEQSIKDKNIKNFSNEMISNYLQLNPEFFYPYYLSGEYYRIKGDKQNALKNYNIALTKEIPKKSERDLILKAIEKTNN
ncbi:MAG: C45 family peptidase [Bacteroidota bacterium]